MSTNKCLVTKLKGSVENDNLPIFGEIVVSIRKRNVDDIIIGLGEYIGSFRIISGNAVLRESDGSIVKKLISNSLFNYKEGTRKGIDISEGDVVIGFTGKYEVTALEINGQKGLFNSKQIPLKDLKHFSNCKEIGVFGNVGFGDLVDAADAINIDTFRFNDRSSPVYVTGDLDEFALAQITYGKTSGTTLISSNSIMTYQGKTYVSGTKFRISYDSTYPNGYTITNLGAI